jgi:hypothetical protein
VLTDPSGAPLADGSYSIRVVIYDAATGGTSLFGEDHTVTLTGGRFNLLIGANTPFPPALLFDRPYYLGVSVNSAPELVPRTELASAPYAMRAAEADRLAANANVVTSINGASGTLTLQGGGGTTITQSGSTVTITSSGVGGTGIQGVQNLDGTIGVTNPSGPVATISLADNSVTSAKIIDGTITAADIAPGVIAGFTLPFTGSASSTSDAFSATNNGAGRAGIFTINRAVSTSNALEVANNGTGSGIYSRMTGTGRAGLFDILNTANTRPALEGVTDGTGIGVSGTATSTTGATRGLYGRSNSSTGVGVYGLASSTTGDAKGLYGEVTSSGGYALYATAPGGGVGVYSTTAGGRAGVFTTTTGTSNAVEVTNQGSGSAIIAKIGTGVTTATPTTPAIRGESSAGTGVAGHSTSSTGVHAESVSGDGVHALSESRAVYAEATGSSGYGVYAKTKSGLGTAIYGQIDAAGGTTAAIEGETSSTQGTNSPTAGATGLLGKVTAANAGTWSAGVRGLSSSTSTTSNGVIGYTSGAGSGVYGESSSGNGVYAFTSGSANSLWVQHDGTGASTTGTPAATTRNLAVFNANGTNVARIDRTGRGFFNGGTQINGADMAEAFNVEGTISAYEPGDVLVISTTSDRTVELSSEPNSTLVAGVYATKPGMLLTERTIDENQSDLVPMGVVGVIPTKVTTENGPIRRGDLLVTSSTPGHAMRAGDDPRTGTVIGKALQAFDGTGTGRIDVLVNVK